ncbi:MAG: ribulose-phosphate 3-epimerase [Acidimicrobiia bacterium]|nr:MAG: ribulose-phosphate 3-epimerase [Acidimicrobiia bacterium]
MFKIAPSLLAADFSRLAEVVAEVEPHSDLLHLDVMDGHFVPNISFGMPVISSLRPHSRLVFDCHLMTTNPGAYLAELASAGADLVTVHIEAVPDPTAIARKARASGLGFGLVLSPPTPWKAVEPFAELCDLVLIMSVHPGFGGQRFMGEVLTKVESARKWVDTHGLAVDIQIDGGINPETAPLARDAGANVFVAGTAIFGSPDPGRAALELRKVIEG